MLTLKRNIPLDYASKPQLTTIIEVLPNIKLAVTQQEEVEKAQFSKNIFIAKNVDNYLILILPRKIKPNFYNLLRYICIKKGDATTKSYNIKYYKSLVVAYSYIKVQVNKDYKVKIEVVIGLIGKNIIQTSDLKGTYQKLQEKELQEKSKKESKKDQKKQVARQGGNSSNKSEGLLDQPI